MCSDDVIDLEGQENGCVCEAGVGLCWDLFELPEFWANGSDKGTLGSVPAEMKSSSALPVPGSLGEDTRGQHRLA